MLGYQLGKNLDVHLGSRITLIGQTFDSGLATDNFTVVGFIRFGVFAMDKKMVLIDLAAAQVTFDMENMVTDWLGYLPSNMSLRRYEELKNSLSQGLGELMKNPPKAWAKDDIPIVLSVLDQRNLGAIVDKFLIIRKFIIGIFLALMVLVLWNAGILNGIHRYGEMGLRLAIGETHRRLVMTLVLETLLISIIGSLAGCVLGGAVTWYFQEVGMNMGDNFAQTGLMIQDVVRARLSGGAFVRGIIPGLTAGVIGTLMASLAIYKRSEANLFRELEAG